MEDPITHEKWALLGNGWLNPEPAATIQAGEKKKKALKRGDTAEVMTLRDIS